MQCLQSEQAILSYMINSGTGGYLQFQDLLSEESFTDFENQAAFSSFSKILSEDNFESLTYVSIVGQLKKQKLDNVITQGKFNKLKDIEVNPEDVEKIAVRLKKLQVYRSLSRELAKKQTQLGSLTGEEPITQLLNLTDFDIDSLLGSSSIGVQQIGDSFREELLQRVEAPVTQMGIATGMPRFDMDIGGGLRDGGLDVICARIKQGKSTFLNNIALHIAKSGIPVLYVDTEMSTREQQNRCAANLANLQIKKIETGSFQNNLEVSRALNAAESMKSLPYYHIYVAGRPFEEHYAIISKWVRTQKKPNKDGEVSKCVVIYDYLKMTTDKDISNNLAEHQALGFMITSLKNLCGKLSFPILTAVQANRDGIDKETTGVAAGSDRILWICTSFSIFKSKSEEERAADGFEKGNRKLSVLAARHGPGTEERDYINYLINGECSVIHEGLRRSEIAEEQKSKKQCNQENQEK